MTSFDSMSCSVARTFNVFADPWTALIIRDLSVGLSRFDDLIDDLSISRKVLTARLNALTEAGIVERMAYQDNPPRYDYVLTEAGEELVPVLFAAMAWGDRWMAGKRGAPVVLRHADHRCSAAVTCDECGEPMTAHNTRGEAGPGARRGPGTSRVGDYLAPRKADAAAHGRG